MIMTRHFLFRKDQIWSRISPETVCIRLHEYNNVIVKVPDPIHLQGNVLDLTFSMFSVFVSDISPQRIINNYYDYLDFWLKLAGCLEDQYIRLVQMINSGPITQFGHFLVYDNIS